MTAALILDARNATGESPVWSTEQQALYWVDIPENRLPSVWGVMANRPFSIPAIQLPFPA